MIEAHTHNTSDSPAIRWDSLTGGITIVSAVPSDVGYEGEPRLYDDGASPTRTYRLYFYINGAWRKLGELAV